MTEILFLDEALSDLAEINTHYSEVAPTSLDNIWNDIYVVMEVLATWPLAGRTLVNKPGRRFVSPKYRFTITYDYRDDRVEIIGIFRFQDRKIE